MIFPRRIRLPCVALLTGFIGGYPAAALAVNWLMVQGTEPPQTKHRLVAFMQPSITVDDSDAIALGPNAGKLAAPATIAPWFNNQERIHFRRLRVGVRGNIGDTADAADFFGKVNYFVLFELAPNLFTYDAFGERARPVGMDHLSLTFNHIPGARLRAGLFKMPGPEESYQGVINIHYNEFTFFTATQVLERFVTGNQRTSPSAGTNGAIGIPTSTAYGFNAARDWGLQVFDSFRQGPWDLSYAATLGRGEDIHTASPDFDQLERYLYLSAEHDLPGGKGPFKHGVKGYAWHQQGKRRFDSDPLEQEFDRVRYGIGVRALGTLFGGPRKHRLAFEWMHAEGMLFAGPVGGVKGGALQFAADRDNTAQGITVDYGFYLNDRWEFDLRWARNDLLRQADDMIWTTGDRRVLTEQTLGAVYHATPFNNVTLNYTFRDLEAPNEPNPVVQDVVGSVQGRWSLQWNYFFQ